jgi:dephospho-CoA kinase
MVHPRIKAHFNTWLKKHADSAIIVKEAAILFESGADKQVDKIIVVAAPEEHRIKRVMERDTLTLSKVHERISKQWPQEELIEKSDFVIDNSGNISLINQVLQIYYSLLN